MMLRALVMAGGRGSRLGMDLEKPLLKVRGVPMIMRVLSALEASPRVGEIHVAVSGNTPRTRDRLLSAGYRVIETSGSGYHEDMRHSIRTLGGSIFLVVSADLPALTPGMVDEVAAAYARAGKPSLTVVAPVGLFLEMGIRPTCTMVVSGEEVAPAGINVIDGSRIGDEYIDEAFLVMRDPRVCININTADDLEAAEGSL